MKYFKNYIIGRERTIKDLLMDQKFLSGLGNIYVNEILFFSGVIPTKKIKQLSDFDIKKIIKFSKKIISKALYLEAHLLKIFLVVVEKKVYFSKILRFMEKKVKIALRLNVWARLKKL